MVDIQPFCMVDVQQCVPCVGATWLCHSHVTHCLYPRIAYIYTYLYTYKTSIYMTVCIHMTMHGCTKLCHIHTLPMSIHVIHGLQVPANLPVESWGLGHLPLCCWQVCTGRLLCMGTGTGPCIKPQCQSHVPVQTRSCACHPLYRSMLAAFLKVADTGLVIYCCRPSQSVWRITVLLHTSQSDTCSDAGANVHHLLSPSAGACSTLCSAAR